MGLQLFIYPQDNPLGAFSQTSTTTSVTTGGGTEYVTDPMFTLSTGMPTFAVGGYVPSVECMDINHPKPTWQGFYSNDTPCVFCNGLQPALQRTATTTPTFAAYNGGANHALRLNGSGSEDYCTGVYQKITGLTSGNRYVLRVTFGNTGSSGSSSQEGDTFTIGSMMYPTGAGNFTDNTGQTHICIPHAGIYNHGSFAYGNPSGHHTGTSITGTIEQEFEAFGWPGLVDQVVVLQYHGDREDYLEILEVSIMDKGARPAVTTTTTTLSDPTDGQVMLDLMDDQLVPVSLSIDNFKNVGEKPQSYSKAFNLPSTKHNNRVFNNLFDVTVTDTGAKLSHFSLHRHTKAILKDTGFTIFEGYLKLLAIKQKDGIPSYNVNLYSDQVSLKTTLAKKTFNDFDGGALGGGLGLSELQHDYNRTNIDLSWGGGLPIAPLPAGYEGAAGVAGAVTTNVLKYFFCQWNTNITPDGTTGYPILSQLEDAFRPWIRIKYLVDRIFSEAGFSYSSDFFNSTDFTRVYMDFNWGKETSMAATSETVQAHQTQQDPSNTIGATYTNLQLNSESWNSVTAMTGMIAIGWDTTNHKFVAPATTTTYTFDAQFVFHINGVAPTTNTTFDCRVVHKDASGTMVAEDVFTLAGSVGTPETWLYSGAWTLNVNETIEFQALNTPAASPWNAGVSQSWITGWSSYNHLITVCDIQPTTSTSNLLQQRGKVKQWDFIKDLFSMFNLVAMQDKQNPNNLIIEPYKDVFIDDSASSYIRINTLDWTDKVDADSMELKPLKLKETIKFDYKKPKDYANKEYTDATNLQFGSFEIDASSFDMAKGEQKIALKVFSPTFLTPLFDDYNVKLTVPHITGGDVAGGANGAVDNNPRICYDATWTSVPSPMSVSPDTYYIPAYAGVTSANYTRFGLCSHLSEHPSDSNTLDLNFGPHQIVGYGGSPPVDNLFQQYWSPYYDELYHPDTRVVKLNVSLTSQDITRFNFNDQIRIKNRLYRANKIDYKPNGLSKVELILLP